MRLYHGLAALALAGAIGLGTGPVLAVDVTVWCWDTNFNGAAMREAAARYAKDHPDVNIIIDDVDTQDNIRAKLQTALLAGNTEGLPDIVLIQDDQAKKYLLSFPGAFEPLGDHIDMSQFAQYKVAAATVDGKSYSLPFDSGVTGLFYRSDYFAEAGFTDEDLQNLTWDQLIEIGKTVKEKTGHELFGIDYNEVGSIRMMLNSAGQWYFKPDGSLNLVDNPTFRAALEVYQKIWTAGLAKPVSGWTNFTNSFTGGDVAAVPIGVWIVGTIKANAAGDAGKWAVAPVPRLDIEGSANASNWGGSSWYVLASSPEEEKAAAIDFLKTVWAGDVDFYQAILANTGAVGTWLHAREGEAYQQKDEFFGGQPVWQNFATWLSQVPDVDYGIFTSEVDSAISAQLPAIAEGGDLDAAIEAINAQALQATQ
ncbi:MAG TPA: extracellular solute-binding protein [Alphaproteobacteria bacterium]|nr:extracellular solute-binding protein [Alphaproteobacteria bacterium]